MHVGIQNGRSFQGLGGCKSKPIRRSRRPMRPKSSRCRRLTLLLSLCCCRSRTGTSAGLFSAKLRESDALARSRTAKKPKKSCLDGIEGIDAVEARREPRGVVGIDVEPPTSEQTAPGPVIADANSPSPTGGRLAAASNVGSITGVSGSCATSAGPKSKAQLHHLARHSKCQTLSCLGLPLRCNHQ